MPPPHKKLIFFSLEMACIGAFLAVLIARKMLNFPPEEVIWWTSSEMDISSEKNQFFMGRGHRSLPC